jgi:hypothetical protein
MNSFVLYTAVVFSLVSSVVRAQPGRCDIQVEPFKELMIVDPLIVESSRANPGGPWHFSSLMRQMLPESATENDLSLFLGRFLNDAKKITTLNGFPLKFPGFSLGEFAACAWLEASGGRQCQNDRVDPNSAPYRLIAIVNRTDLHGHGIDQAEGRFVFAALSRPTKNPVSDPSVFAMPETVNFEYHLPLKGPEDLKSWAEAWHDVGQGFSRCTTTENCEPLREKLEALTRRFSSRNLVAAKPNGNPLGQLRTSHIAALTGTEWSFRQFALTGNGVSASLVSVPTGQTPHHSFDDNAEFRELINANAQAVLNGRFIVPQKYLGAEAIVDDSEQIQWKLPGVDGEVRRAFSHETCNGCHSESPTIDGFFHISPVATGNHGQNRISEFLLNEELPKRSAAFKDLLCRNPN